MPAYPDLPSLLGAHGLGGVEEHDLTHSGFSGARITSLTRADDRRFVLKRMSLARDWIMRATDDTSCREAAFADAAPPLAKHITTPSLGIAPVEGGMALLMDDLSGHLLPPDRISETQTDAIIGGMAALHALPLPAQDAAPWCDLRRRLLLLTPAGARIASAYGAPVADDLARGWQLFDALTPLAVAAQIRSLSEDPAPLIAALATLPRSLLHGDLKFDNIGLDPAGRMWLIDWAMPMLAPPALELGWFLAINSRRLPLSLDETMRRYAAAAGMEGSARDRHDASAVLCGLLLRGWRKALDADGGAPEELRWWCERASEAASLLRL